MIEDVGGKRTLMIGIGIGIGQRVIKDTPYNGDNEQIEVFYRMKMYCTLLYCIVLYCIMLHSILL